MSKRLQNAQLEQRVRAIAALVEAGQKLEDARVELKAELPMEFPQVAKMIGGLANAARGDTVLWIVGLSEERGVIGTGDVDLQSWWPRVRKRFDAPAPELVCDLRVFVGDRVLYALEFDTTRAPYVVKREDNSGEFEVPWRRGTETHTASRSDLLRLLLPLALTPEAEVIHGGASYDLESAKSQGVTTTIGHRQVVDTKVVHTHRIRVHASVYLTPRTQDAVVIPFHRCAYRLIGLSEGPAAPSSVQLGPGQRAQYVSGKMQRIDLPSSIQFTPSEATLVGPGRLFLNAEFRLSSPPPKSFRVTADLSMIGVPKDIQVRLDFECPNDMKGNGDHFRLVGKSAAEFARGDTDPTRESD